MNKLNNNGSSATATIDALNHIRSAIQNAPEAESLSREFTISSVNTPSVGFDPKTGKGMNQGRQGDVYALVLPADFFTNAMYKKYFTKVEDPAKAAALIQRVTTLREPTVTQGSLHGLAHGNGVEVYVPVDAEWDRNPLFGYTAGVANATAGPMMRFTQDNTLCHSSQHPHGPGHIEASPADPVNVMFIHQLTWLAAERAVARQRD